MFAVDPAFAIVEYGSGAARRFGRWLQSESFRGAGGVLLCAYVAVRDAAAWRRWRRALPRRCPGLRILRHGLVAPRDYQAGVHARWRGRCVGRRLWVGPPWVNPPTDRLAVVIEPGLAFGTGDHPTTRLCLAALDRLSARRFCVRRVFDVGTGSGVLAIAAA
ncbi:50S ribosomal protein L11 methyltransferase, partial [bacterium]|nr:50S ribosomal protein L11 methyltransferase [bacterium]